MGSDAHYPEEAPDPPRCGSTGSGIDAYAVTNAEFAAFVAATGYVTVAERPLDPADYPGAPGREPRAGLAGVHAHARPGRPAPPEPVVDVDARGRRWRHPEGPAQHDRRPRSTIRSSTSPTRTPPPTRPGPGRALPTEAEWEYAARGGLDGAEFTWGDESSARRGAILANRWDGPDFPWRSTGESGLTGTAPVGSFPPNGFGLHDMAGNVWEWTDDWYTERPPGRRRQGLLRAREPSGRRPSTPASTPPSRSSASPAR